MKRDKIDSSSDMITVEAIRGSHTNLIPINSLLMVIRSGILRHTFPVAANTTPVAINQDIKALTLAAGFDVDFFRYQLKANSDRILTETVKSGTTVESVNFA